jgi:predicted aspartyl protease
MAGLIDTGFNGELLLPFSMRDRVPHRKIAGKDQVETVGGTIEADKASATIDWIDGPRDVELLFSAEHVALRRNVVPLLVGTRLLSGCRLMIDFLEEKTSIVLIERSSGAP